MRKIECIDPISIERASVELCRQFGVAYHMLPDESTYLSRQTLKLFASKFEVKTIAAAMLWNVAVGNATPDKVIKITYETVGDIDYRVTPPI